MSGAGGLPRLQVTSSSDRADGLRKGRAGTYLDPLGKDGILGGKPLQLSTALHSAPVPTSGAQLLTASLPIKSSNEIPHTTYSLRTPNRILSFSLEAY